MLGGGSKSSPKAMDALMPIVCQPAPITGRNLLWRRIVSHAVRTDPDWRGGDYSEQPRGFTSTFPLVRMMLGGVPELEATAATPEAADALIRSASKAASDHLVRAWGETYGLPVVVSNCSNNYGPYQFLKN